MTLRYVLYQIACVATGCLAAYFGRDPSPWMAAVVLIGALGRER